VFDRPLSSASKKLTSYGTDSCSEKLLSLGLAFTWTQDLLNDYFYY